MKLKFFAREDLLVAYPGIMPVVGQPRLYVGRQFDADAKTYPATAEGHTFDSDSPEGARVLMRAKRNPSLWPADKETAAACGVEFVPVEFKDGVFHPAQQASRKTAAKDS
jgi:hypothetical protein